MFLDGHIEEFILFYIGRLLGLKGPRQLDGFAAAKLNFGTLGTAVQLSVPEATLDGPAEVGVGETFDVDWAGPEAMGDFVAVFAPGADTDAYLSFADASAGSPAVLEAPSAPGTYEIRYLSGVDGRVLWQEQLSVLATAVEIDAPATVYADTRFELRWTGPAAAGDFLCVVPAGASKLEGFLPIHHHAETAGAVARQPVPAAYVEPVLAASRNPDTGHCICNRPAQARRQEIR